jgi:hypothetical protein
MIYHNHLSFLNIHLCVGNGFKPFQKNAINNSLSVSSWKFLADVRSLNNYFPYGLKINEYII